MLVLAHCWDPAAAWKVGGGMDNTPIGARNPPVPYSSAGDTPWPVETAAQWQGFSATLRLENSTSQSRSAGRDLQGDKSISPFPLGYPHPEPQTRQTDGTLNFSSDGNNWSQRALPLNVFLQRLWTDDEVLSAGLTTHQIPFCALWLRWWFPPFSPEDLRNLSRNAGWWKRCSEQ